MKLNKFAWCLGLLFAASACLNAQSTFVYTNNDINPGLPNSVSAFSVGPDGALTPVAGSPFLTGGSGFNPTATLTSPSRIAVTTIPGNFLYATNDASNSVSGFSIDTTTGVLTPIPGSPFAAGAVNNSGISLAVTPDGQFLYAGNNNAASLPISSSISAFSIASNGTLTPTPGSPFPNPFGTGLAINMKVTPDRKFLAVAQGGAGVAMFSIGSNGALTPVSDSPFAAPEGLDVNCASNLLFAPNGSLGGVVVLNITSNGVLTFVTGSPFTFSGKQFLVDVLSPDDQHLFVSDGVLTRPTITSLNVASGGSLAEVSGSPFSTSLGFPITMATNQAGTLLYAAMLGEKVDGFNIDSNGALNPVLGSPFSTGVFGGLPSVAVFPPKSCVLPVGIEIKPPASPPVPINPGAHGKIPVAILSTLSFNAVTEVDTSTLTFGHTGNEASLAFCGGGEDVNGDGLVDLVCHFNTAQTGFVAGDTTAFLNGQTVSGRKIQGSEAIRTVP